ncbi:MAG: endolytic transglycosylase MltG [Hyphomonadaceae bacterium]|nr:endolytic transglycosylase MltG [Clostridia bacterium]
MVNNKIIFSVLALVLCAMLIYPIWMDVVGVSDVRLATVKIEIAPNATQQEVMQTLVSKRVLRFPTFYHWYLKLNTLKGDVQSGSHTLKPAMGYRALAKALSTPVASVFDVRVTIPEGFELKQIAKKFAEAKCCTEKEFLDAAKLPYDFAFLSTIPERPIRLEGYLFPDTYDFPIKTKPEIIIHTMLKRFDEMLTPSLRDRAKEKGMTIDQTIILASIIEREAKLGNERSHISAVFKNRLASKKTPYLQSCATVQYILGERKPILSVADTKIKSPYNTYLHAGLPVGPIASPGLASIEAALYPERSEDLFFVAKKDGSHLFSKTYEAHMKNVKIAEKE